MFFFLKVFDKYQQPRMKSEAVQSRPHIWSVRRKKRGERMKKEEVEEAPTAVRESAPDATTKATFLIKSQRLGTLNIDIFLLRQVLF